MQERWVKPSSGHSWMVVVQAPASPSAPPSLVTTLPSSGETPASSGGVTEAVPDTWLPPHPATMSSANRPGNPERVPNPSRDGLRQAEPGFVRALTTAAGHRTVDLTLALPLLGVFTFVPALLAVDQGQLGLHAPLLFIQRQGHQRAPFLANLSGQALDLAPVEQQLALAARVVVALIGEGVHADVHLVQPGLATVEIGEGVDQGHLPGADRLDLRADQHDAGFQRLVDVVLVTRLLVAGEHLH